MIELCLCVVHWNVLGAVNVLSETDTITNLHDDIQRTNEGRMKQNRWSNARNILHYKIFDCSHCSKLFATKYQLRAHLIRHRNKSKRICTICNRHYSNETALNEHMTRHQPEMIKFRCDKAECGKGFLYERTYKQHMMTHGAYKCSECGKNFASRYTLDDHVRKHLNLLKHRCEICPTDKRFSNKNRLNAHEKTEMHVAWKRIWLEKQMQKTLKSADEGKI